MIKPINDFSMSSSRETNVEETLTKNFSNHEQILFNKTYNFSFISVFLFNWISKARVCAC